MVKVADGVVVIALEVVGEAAIVERPGGAWVDQDCEVEILDGTVIY